MNTVLKEKIIQTVDAVDRPVMAKTVRNTY